MNKQALKEFLDEFVAEREVCPCEHGDCRLCSLTFDALMAYERYANTGDSVWTRGSGTMKQVQ